MTGFSIHFIQNLKDLDIHTDIFYHPEKKPGTFVSRIPRVKEIIPARNSRAAAGLFPLLFPFLINPKMARKSPIATRTRYE